MWSVSKTIDKITFFWYNIFSSVTLWINFILKKEGIFKWKIKIPKNYFIIDEKELGKLEEDGNKIAKKNLPKNSNIQNAIMFL